MKILMITHDIVPYEKSKKKMRWTRFPKHFADLGHTVKYIYKYRWWTYPFVYSFFGPDIVISVGKTAGLITAYHYKLPGRRNSLFVHDLTDYYAIYKSDDRMKFLVKNHDISTTPSWYNYTTFGCTEFIMHGCDYSPHPQITRKFDVCYQGSQNDFYGLEELQQQCASAKISLYNIHGFSSEETEIEMCKARIAVMPLNWDSSLKSFDYLCVKLPVVMKQPHLLQKINYPAYYCDDLIVGINYLLKHPKIAAKLADEGFYWFHKRSGTWKEQAQKYLSIIEKHWKKKVTG